MKARILIVEDEPAIVDNLEYALQTEGFATMSRATGGGVPSLLESERIDLIILDIGLPDVNGLELCNTIRQHHSVPVIFLTARAEEVDRVVGLEIGADAVADGAQRVRRSTALTRAQSSRGLKGLTT